MDSHSGLIKLLTRTAIPLVFYLLAVVCLEWLLAGAGRDKVEYFIVFRHHSPAVDQSDVPADRFGGMISQLIGRNREGW